MSFNFERKAALKALVPSAKNAILFVSLALRSACVKSDSSGSLLTPAQKTRGARLALLSFPWPNITALCHEKFSPATASPPPRTALPSLAHQQRHGKPAFLFRPRFARPSVCLALFTPPKPSANHPIF